METTINTTSNKKGTPTAPKRLEITVKNPDTGEVILSSISDIVIFGAVLPGFSMKVEGKDETQVPIHIIHIGTALQQAKLLSYISNQVTGFLLHFSDKNKNKNVKITS